MQGKQWVAGMQAPSREDQPGVGGSVQRSCRAFVKGEETQGKGPFTRRSEKEASAGVGSTDGLGPAEVHAASVK